jgi:uncharacterized protein YggE
MHRGLSLIIGMVFLGAPLAVRGQQPGQTGHPEMHMMMSAPEIVTSAQGEAQYTPDRAHIYIGVQTRAKTAQEASAENARKQDAVIAAIQALGIPKERIGTVNYSVYPEQQYNPQQGDKEPKIVGYNVNNSVRVDIHDISKVGAIIDAALSKGANNINSLDFYASNQDSTRRQALAEAVQRARGDAEALARGAGGQLGELIELSSAPVYAPPRPVPYMAMARAESVSATPVNASEQTLTVTVTARWKFVVGGR